MLSRRDLIRLTAGAGLLGSFGTEALARVSLPVGSTGNARVSGPVTGGTHGWPFGSYLGGLDSFDYDEEEYFLEGMARRYVPEDELRDDGKWTVREAGEAPFKTRMIVQLPKDRRKFNGTVIVEWINVSAGYDVLFHDREMLFRQGFAYVGISAQVISLNGIGAHPLGLRLWDAARYGSLNHPGDSYCYDIFSLGAAAVGPGRARSPLDPMRGLDVRKIIAAGASQSATRLTSYANAIQSRDGIFDAILLAVSFGAGPQFDDTIYDRSHQTGTIEEQIRATGWTPTRIREDLRIPVMTVNTETECILHGQVQQPDSSRFRFWEVAGATHFPASMLERIGGMAKRDFGAAPSAGAPIVASQVNWPLALDAATLHVNRWINDGTPPPVQQRMEVVGGSIVRDENGLARGGVRLPEVSVPTAENDGVGNGLLGHHRPFSPARLKDLYPTHDGYVRDVTAAAEAAKASGALSSDAVQWYVEQARLADVPPKG